MTVSALLAFLTLGFCAENTLSLEGKKLTLNGSGIYTATIFAVKVYEQSLYLEKPNHDGEAIKASDQLKVFRMKFLRELPEDKFRDGWVTNHLKRCHDLPCLKAEADLKKMLALFRTWTEGTTYDYVISKNQLRIYTNGVKQGEITSDALTDYLLEIWVGKKFDVPMRDYLLGIKKD